jgi:hypothetical protein
MTPEGKVKAKVKKILAELGAYYAMPMGTGFGNAGVPDFLVCYRGLFIGLETKANGGEPTKLQQKNLLDIVLAGGHSLLVNEKNVDNLRNLLENLHD